MDKDGSGQITVSDVKNVYDVKENQDFIDGTKSADEVIEGFLNNFDGAKGNNDGVISKQEFIDYYTDLSMSTPSEDYFCRMMEQAWCLAEKEDSLYDDKIKFLVNTLRQKLLSKANNVTEEFLLR